MSETTDSSFSDRSPRTTDGSRAIRRVWTRLAVEPDPQGPARGMVGLFEALAASDRFHRDSRLGRIFHPGKVSFREASATDSLHVIIDGSRVSVHVDEVSPLRRRSDGSFRYSWTRVLVHNLVAGIADLGRRMQRVQGHQRCNLDCEVVLIEENLPPLDAGDTENPE